MTDVKSKNLYELLGNTSDQDSDREPEPPTKAIDKSNARSGKRDAPKQAPAPGPASNDVGGARGGRGGNRGDARGGFNANETAFRDRATGRNRNREQPTGDDEGYRGRGRGRGRGGPRRGGDRHSRTGVGEHQKQAGHGWGEQTGDGEWADERAGAAIATQEVKEGGWDADKNEAWNENAQSTAIPEDSQAIPEGEAEPEDTSKSYAEYLAEKAAAKLGDLGLKEARAPNEGSKDNKKWKNAKELTKEESEDYIKGEEKARRERDRTRNAKQLLDIDYSFKEQQPRDTRGGGRGGRGRGRGERGEFRGDRGGDRGDRGDRGERGEFRGGRGGGDRGDRGEFRGGRGRGGRGDRGGDRGDRGGQRGDRGDSRGGRGGRGIAINDSAAFPSLGGK